VRKIYCPHCENFREASGVFEVRPGVSERLRALVPELSMDPRWLSLPVAALAVFAILTLVRGEDAPPSQTSSAGAVAKPDRAPAQADAKAKESGSAIAKPVVPPADAQLVTQSTFSVALPGGWDRVKPAAGATFAAVAQDGSADVTLWIQNDPKLDFAAFEANSLAQLQSLTGSARVVERNMGPSVEASSVVLAPKSASSDAPTYEVVLRGSNDNWYYLATTHQPGAPAESIEGVELIQGSFLPVGGK
jgi:hypothetical protein